MAFAAASHASVPNSPEIYLFPYFQNNGNSGIYLSDSTNGINFNALNGGNPIFTPPASFGSQNLTRDPAIIYQNGIFDMVWTSNWTGNVFGFAQSTNLKNWTNIQEIQPFTGITQPANVWAPEIQYNPVNNNYVIMFSSAMSQSDYNNDNLRMYSITSTNLASFSSASTAPFFDPGYSVIDGQMIYAPQSNQWIMVYKNESAGQKNLNIATISSNTLDIALEANNGVPISDWTLNANNPIIGPGSGNTDPSLLQAAEGPILRRSLDGTQWFLYWDAFENGHFAMASSTNLVNWTYQNMTNPVSDPRHGAIFFAPSSAVAYLAAPEPATLHLLVTAILSTTLLLGRRRRNRSTDAGRPA
jgi:hypothetical protein